MTPDSFAPSVEPGAPTPVVVTNVNAEPVPVTMTQIPDTEQQSSQIALRSGGQRRINMIWEFTQSFIAVTVTTTTLGVCAWIVKGDKEITTAVALLSNAFFLVIGFYFGRTNHQKVGGVGAAPGNTR